MLGLVLVSVYFELAVRREDVPRTSRIRVDVRLEVARNYRVEERGFVKEYMAGDGDRVIRSGYDVLQGVAELTLLLNAWLPIADESATLGARSKLSSGLCVLSLTSSDD
jgi:hypothetical protein